MEAAIVAAQRGHQVQLFEKSGKLGGQFLIAAVPPAKGEFSSFIVWQKNQLQKWGVQVHLNTELTENRIAEEHPDVVIIATGAEPVSPDIPGKNKAHVFISNDVLSGMVALGRDVIVIGGGMVGAELANHLAVHEKKVKIVEMQSDIARDEMQPIRIFMMEEFRKNNVDMYVNTRVKEIVEDGVIVQTEDGERKIHGDSVVLALGSKPVDVHYDNIHDSVQLIKIGDSVKVRKALDAIEEGYRVALTI